LDTLNRYIAIEVIKATLVSALVLVTLVLFFTLADEVGDIGKGQYDFWAVVKYVALTSPSVFYDLLPSSALIGTMFALGSMSNNREIVAMRCAGIAVSRIVLAVMRAGLILVVISVIVGEFVSPTVNRIAREFKATTQSGRIASWSIYGFWVRDGHSFINIRQINDRTSLGNITIYDVDFDHGLGSIQHAEKADFSDGMWVLTDVENTSLSKTSVEIDRKPSKDWESVIDPDLLNVVVVNPGNLSVMGLYRYIRFLKDNEQQTRRFELAFWQKVIDPLVTLVMLLVAIPFVMNVSRSVGMGQRMLTGILIGLVFILFDRVVGQMGLVYNMKPIVAALLPGFVFLVFALIMMRRVS